MSVRSVIRVISVALWILFVLIYIAAKVDFFTQYFRLGMRQYLREHSVYWAAMALTVFLIWLAERLLSHRRR